MSLPTKGNEFSKPDNHRHDIQSIRCKCGLTHSSYQEWIDHFVYRYMLLNNTKMPVNIQTGQPNPIPISFEYLRREILKSLNMDDRTLFEIIAFHSGKHSHDDNQASRHPRKQLGQSYVDDEQRKVNQT